MKKIYFSITLLLLSIASFSQTKSYAGNGNYGFNGTAGDGPIGGSTLTVNFDGTNLNFTLVTPFSTNNSNVNISNNVLAVYIDNGSGSGFNSTSSFIDQTAGVGSVADGIAGVDGSNAAPLTFPVGFNAQYGIGIGSDQNNPAVLVAKLAGSAPFTNEVTPTLTTDHDSTTFKFSITPAQIGLGGTNFSFRFFGSLISNTGYRSNEAIGINVGGALAGGANIGFASYSDTTAALTFSAGNLAVNFGNFSGVVKNNAVNLSWKTETESNLSQFQVLRSNDGAGWKTIGTVAAKNIATGTQYSFTDNSPLAKNYYRLKIADKDGKINYSNVLIIVKNAVSSITLLGNPVSNAVRLNISNDNAGAYQIALYSSDGKTLAKQVFNHASGTDKATINIPSSVKGICLLKVTSGSTTQTFNVLVQ